MGDDRKPPKPEAPTRKARKFELEAVLARQARKSESSLHVGEPIEDEPEERTEIRVPRPAAAYVPYDEGEVSEETGRAYYNPPEDALEIAPRHDTQPIPPPAASPITAPLAPPLPPPTFSRPPPHFSVPPAVPAIPPGPHGAGAPFHVPPMPAVPLDGDELAAITRDFQRRRRRVFAAIGITLALIVIALLVHEPLLEAIRGR